MILNFENNVIYGIFLYSGLAVARNIWRNSLRGPKARLQRGTPTWRVWAPRTRLADVLANIIWTCLILSLTTCLILLSWDLFHCSEYLITGLLILLIYCKEFSVATTGEFYGNNLSWIWQPWNLFWYSKFYFAVLFDCHKFCYTAASYTCYILLPQVLFHLLSRKIQALPLVK